MPINADKTAVVRATILTDSIPHELTPRRIGRCLVFAVVGIGLLWAVVSHTLVAALARIAPEWAQIIRLNDPGVLETLTDQLISDLRRAPASSDGTLRLGFTGDRSGFATLPSGGSKVPTQGVETDEAVRLKGHLQRWALAMLSQEPGNGRALVLLGELKRDAGEGEAAAALLRASARRSIREPVPQAWLIDDAIEQQDWPTAMRHADILMRMHKRAIPHLVPLLARLAETSETAPLVKAALQHAPPWRGEFMTDVVSAVRDARTPLDLLFALKDTPTPPTLGEIKGYLTFLIQRKYYDLAYYAWLELLPPEQRASVGLLVNGSFERRPSGLPFDWSLPVGGTASVSIARRPDRPDARALVVNFGQGRVELGATTQLIRLPSGDYQVAGEALGDVVGRRSVRWRIACLEDQSIVGQSDMFVGEMLTWTSFSFSVRVPEKGCTAQRLSLDLDARSPTERLVSGTIWFDEMSIRRESSASRSQTGSLPPQSQFRQR